MFSSILPGHNWYLEDSYLVTFGTWEHWFLVTSGTWSTATWSHLVHGSSASWYLETQCLVPGSTDSWSHLVPESTPSTWEHCLLVTPGTWSTACGWYHRTCSRAEVCQLPVCEVFWCQWWCGSVIDNASLQSQGGGNKLVQLKELIWTPVKHSLSQLSSSNSFSQTLFFKRTDPFFFKRTDPGSLLQKNWSRLSLLQKNWSRLSSSDSFSQTPSSSKKTDLDWREALPLPGLLFKGTDPVVTVTWWGWWSRLSSSQNWRRILWSTPFPSRLAWSTPFPSGPLQRNWSKFKQGTRALIRFLREVILSLSCLGMGFCRAVDHSWMTLKTVGGLRGASCSSISTQASSTSGCSGDTADRGVNSGHTVNKDVKRRK